MLKSIILPLAVSCILGYLSGQGVGGGTIMMIWLTVIMKVPYSAAKTINLLFYIGAVIVSLLFSGKQKQLPWGKILPVACFAMTGAFICSHLAPYIESRWVQKGFGILLIIAGVREFFYRAR